MLTIKILGDDTTDTVSLYKSYGVPSVGDILNLECSTGLKKKFVQLRVISRTFTTTIRKSTAEICLKGLPQR